MAAAGSARRMAEWKVSARISALFKLKVWVADEAASPAGHGFAERRIVSSTTMPPESEIGRELADIPQSDLPEFSR